ncbi:hypothetical protein, conserved [Plasmodium gonderi]|uniref:Uncharacterized protein n=1 Tax=Plasmodium gonderi TaxID=77519 RepID=A0A1Y1JDJ9_PLAGO|nr:hypothetical protein, conserved [Plasmodium gonderi]GAW79287.1 hypothetical protein, conserved [Plasmodium gonderi]
MHRGTVSVPLNGEWLNHTDHMCNRRDRKNFSFFRRNKSDECQMVHDTLLKYKDVEKDFFDTWIYSATSRLSSMIEPNSIQNDVTLSSISNRLCIGEEQNNNSPYNVDIQKETHFAQYPKESLKNRKLAHSDNSEQDANTMVVKKWKRQEENEKEKLINNQTNFNIPNCDLTGGERNHTQMQKNDTYMHMSDELDLKYGKLNDLGLHNNDKKEKVEYIDVVHCMETNEHINGMMISDQLYNNSLPPNEFPLKSKENDSTSFIHRNKWLVRNSRVRSDPSLTSNVYADSSSKNIRMNLIYNQSLKIRNEYPNIMNEYNGTKFPKSDFQKCGIIKLENDVKVSEDNKMVTMTNKEQIFDYRKFETVKRKFQCHPCLSVANDVLFCCTTLPSSDERNTRNDTNGFLIHSKKVKKEEEIFLPRRSCVEINNTHIGTPFDNEGGKNNRKRNSEGNCTKMNYHLIIKKKKNNMHIYTPSSNVSLANETNEQGATNSMNSRKINETFLNAHDAMKVKKEIYIHDPEKNNISISMQNRTSSFNSEKNDEENNRASNDNEKRWKNRVTDRGMINKIVGEHELWCRNSHEIINSECECENENRKINQYEEYPERETRNCTIEHPHSSEYIPQFKTPTNGIVKEEQEQVYMDIKLDYSSPNAQAKHNLDVCSNPCSGAEKSACYGASQELLIPMSVKSECQEKECKDKESAKMNETCNYTSDKVPNETTKEFCSGHRFSTSLRTRKRKLNEVQKTKVKTEKKKKKKKKKIPGRVYKVIVRGKECWRAEWFVQKNVEERDFKIGNSEMPIMKMEKDNHDINHQHGVNENSLVQTDKNNNKNSLMKKSKQFSVSVYGYENARLFALFELIKYNSVPDGLKDEANICIYNIKKNLLREEGSTNKSFSNHFLPFVLADESNIYSSSLCRKIRGDVIRNFDKCNDGMSSNNIHRIGVSTGESDINLCSSNSSQCRSSRSTNQQGQKDEMCVFRQEPFFGGYNNLLNKMGHSRNFNCLASHGISQISQGSNPIGQGTSQHNVVTNSTCQMNLSPMGCVNNRIHNMNTYNLNSRNMDHHHLHMNVPKNYIHSYGPLGGESIKQHNGMLFKRFVKHTSGSERDWNFPRNNSRFNYNCANDDSKTKDMMSTGSNDPTCVNTYVNRYANIRTSPSNLTITTTRFNNFTPTYENEERNNKIDKDMTTFCSKVGNERSTDIFNQFV